MKFIEHTIEVWGRLPFPLDMLRYDNCVPATGEDAVRIEDSLAYRTPIGVDNPIRLKCYHPTLRWEPTFGRWESFSWNARTPR